LKNIIFCWTYDEMNAEYARAWCDEHGMVFQLAHHEDALFPPEAGAIAIDLNHLAMEASERAQFVRRLESVLLPYPVAVASYDLDAEAIPKLRVRGVLVSRRMGQQLLFELTQAINQNATACAAYATIP
jgi:hypothetical protein